MRRRSSIERLEAGLLLSAWIMLVVGEEWRKRRREERRRANNYFKDTR
jgi:hypothetical protein